MSQITDTNINPLMNLSVGEDGGNVPCNEDFQGFPLRLSLTLWAILEIAWDQKSALPRGIAVLLGKTGVVDSQGDEQLTINPHIAIFMSESLTLATQRPLNYCQNPRLSKVQAQNIQAEDIKTIVQMRRASHLLFGDFTQYQWNKVMPEKKSRLTLYKWAYAAAILSRGPLDHRARMIKALKHHLPMSAKAETPEDFRRDMLAINREITIQVHGQGLGHSHGHDRLVVLTMLALLAHGLLIFDRRYTDSERSILQVFFKKFAVTQQEATHFKTLSLKPAGELFATIPPPNRFAVMVYILSSLMADDKLSGGEHEYLRSLSGGHAWSPAEEAIFAGIKAVS